MNAMEAIVSRMLEAMAASVILLAILTLGYVSPWSPLAQRDSGVSTPYTSNLFNPDATLDTSRMRDRL